MRVARFHLLAGLLLLTECGSKQDLVIGSIGLTEAGATSSGAGGSAGDASGGTPSIGGSTGGSIEPAAGAAGQAAAAGDSAMAGAAGEGGESGLPPEDCVPGEQPPLDSLIHRYSFDGIGLNAVDSVGSMNGLISPNAALTGDGVLDLASGSDFVDLNNNILQDLTEVTVVAWTTWRGSAGWQRVFDFGISEAGEGQHNGGRSYFCLMAATGFDNQNKPGLGGEIKAPGFDTVRLASKADMKNRYAQVAFSFKGGVSASIYLDGDRLAMQETPIKLSDIQFANNWIGQSQYPDTNYNGTYREFRIYKTALNGCQLHTLLVNGPETP